MKDLQSELIANYVSGYNVPFDKCCVPRRKRKTVDAEWHMVHTAADAEKKVHVCVYTHGGILALLSVQSYRAFRSHLLYTTSIYILPISTNGIPLKIFDRVNSAWMCDITRRDWKFISNELDRLEQLVVEKNTMNEWEVRIIRNNLKWISSYLFFCLFCFAERKIESQTIIRDLLPRSLERGIPYQWSIKR